MKGLDEGLAGEDDLDQLVVRAAGSTCPYIRRLNALLVTLLGTCNDTI